MKIRKTSEPSSGKLTKSQIIPGLIVIAVIVSVAYTHFKPRFTDNSEQKSEVRVTKVSESRAPNVAVTTDEVNSGENNCEEFSDLCESLELKSPGEKIFYSEEKFYINIDYEDFLKKINSPFLAKEPMSQQVEYVLANYAFHPKVLKAAKEKEAKFIIISGVDSILNKAKYSLSVEVSKVEPSTEEEHKNFFSGIFHGGIFRPYRRNLRPFIKFTDHY